MNTTEAQEPQHSSGAPWLEKLEISWITGVRIVLGPSAPPSLCPSSGVSLLVTSPFPAPYLPSTPISFHFIYLINFLKILNPRQALG